MEFCPIRGAFALVAGACRGKQGGHSVPSLRRECACLGARVRLLHVLARTCTRHLLSNPSPDTGYGMGCVFGLMMAGMAVSQPHLEPFSGAPLPGPDAPKVPL